MDGASMAFRVDQISMIHYDTKNHACARTVLFLRIKFHLSAMSTTAVHAHSVGLQHYETLFHSYVQ